MSEINETDSSDEREEISSGESKIEVGGQIQTFGETTPKEALKMLRSEVKDYEDYASVPDRRKSDESFRKYVGISLTQTNDRIKEIHAMLIEKQQMSTWAVADQVINDIGAFIRDVARGDYGFTTFFQNPKLLELDISQLYIIDGEFIDSLKVLRDRTEAFMEMVRRNYFEDIDLWFETLNRIIGKQIRLFEDRLKLIGSYERISY